MSGTGIFKSLPNGKFTYADEYKLKLGTKNPATGEKLQNKGKLAKTKALLTHKKSDAEFSGKYDNLLYIPKGMWIYESVNT